MEGEDKMFTFGLHLEIGPQSQVTYLYMEISYLGLIDLSYSLLPSEMLLHNSKRLCGLTKIKAIYNPLPQSKSLWSSNDTWKSV